MFNGLLQDEPLKILGWRCSWTGSLLPSLISVFMTTIAVNAPWVDICFWTSGTGGTVEQSSQGMNPGWAKDQACDLEKVTLSLCASFSHRRHVSATVRRPTGFLGTLNVRWRGQGPWRRQTAKTTQVRVQQAAANANLALLHAFEHRNRNQIKSTPREPLHCRKYHRHLPL